MQFADQPHLHVIPWTDPVIDLRGFDPTSAYVELCWLPVIGPSATWMLRRLAAGLTPHPEGYPVDIVELAAALGLGTGTGRNSPVLRTLRRLGTFGLARAQDEVTVGVRRRVPPLVQPQVRRLTVPLQRAHEQLLAAHQPVATAS
jgi:hypothetical protein